MCKGLLLALPPRAFCHLSTCHPSPAPPPPACPLQGLNVVRPSLFGPALAELAASLQRLAVHAAAGLQALAGMDPHSSSVLTTGTARYGRLMLVGVVRGAGR